MKWLFLIQQIRTPNSRERVKVWRLLKKIGALPYRNSVYVLPYNKDRLEDFQWLSQQIEDSKGEASVFVSESIDEREDQTIRGIFERNREEEYTSILSSAENLLDRVRKAKKQRRFSDAVLKKLSKDAKHLNKSFVEVERIDFFSMPIAGKVRGTLEQITIQLTSSDNQGGSPASINFYSQEKFKKKVWTTRERIHIDRLCSAWLIRRFIDQDAKFVFAPESNLPKDAIQFDVFGVEFSHHGEDCTFETLLKSFQLKDKALTAVAEIVHDVDMKDNKFGRPEAAGLDTVVRALSEFHKDDDKILEIGSVILDALYSYLVAKKQKRR